MGAVAFVCAAPDGISFSEQSPRIQGKNADRQVVVQYLMSDELVFKTKTCRKGHQAWKPF